MFLILDTFSFWEQVGLNVYVPTDDGLKCQTLSIFLW